MTQAATRPLTGRHIAAILVCGFGVVIGVNFTAAVIAKRSFGGVVVENSYVASQDFNRWLAEAEAEQALGWKVGATHRSDGRVALALTGVPTGARVVAEARHPLGHAPDTALTFDVNGRTALSREALPAGRWTLRVTVEAADRRVRSESVLP